MSETDLADEMYNSLTVPELREFCSENGVSRERGASKAETVRAAVDQAPEAVAERLGVEVEEPPAYEVCCPCDLEAEHDELGDALAAAEDHMDECSRGVGVAGLGGLAVWSTEYGNRVWTPEDGRIE